MIILNHFKTKNRFAKQVVGRSRWLGGTCFGRFGLYLGGREHSLSNLVSSYFLLSYLICKRLSYILSSYFIVPYFSYHHRLIYPFSFISSLLISFRLQVEKRLDFPFLPQDETGFPFFCLRMKLDCPFLSSDVTGFPFSVPG